MRIARNTECNGWLLASHACNLPLLAASSLPPHPPPPPRPPLGLLIDFGLAEPAEKWKCRSEALATHRTRRARRKQSRSENPLGLNSKNGNPSHRGTTNRSATNRSGHESRSTAMEERASDDRARDKEKGERSKLLRKVERGGTTGFRAPEILWHCRDQVGRAHR